MSPTSSSQKVSTSSRFATVYAGVWTILATASLAYLAVLAIEPGLLAGLAPRPAEPATADFNQAASRFATDISGIRKDVNSITREVETLKTGLAASDERSKEVLNRLSAVEEKVKQPAVASAPAAILPKTAAQRLAEAKALKAAQRVQASSQGQPAPAQVAEQNAMVPSERVTVLNAPPASPAVSAISTGSLQVPSPPAQGVPPPAPVIPFGPGAVRAAPQPVAIELASGPSLDALRLNWSLLADKNATLQNLEPRYTSGGEGQPYQLVAGPINSPEEAARVCAQLKAKRVACRVTGFGGNAL